jgi:iron-sulfur cluster assembly protein
MLPSDLPSGDPGLKVSDIASSYITDTLTKTEKPAIGLRVGVKKAGCSGYEYVLEYAYSESITEIDYEFKQEGFSIIIDKETYLKFLKGGTVLDFTSEGLNQGLSFNNPNVGHQCGCGESFTLVDE